jgi:hypothetical protein
VPFGLQPKHHTRQRFSDILLGSTVGNNHNHNHSFFCPFVYGFNYRGKPLRAYVVGRHSEN